MLSVSELRQLTIDNPFANGLCDRCEANFTLQNDQRERIGFAGLDEFGRQRSAPPPTQFDNQARTPYLGEAGRELAQIVDIGRQVNARRHDEIT